jgi:hypothetical protein
MLQMQETCVFQSLILFIYGCLVNIGLKLIFILVLIWFIEIIITCGITKLVVIMLGYKKWYNFLSLGDDI